MARRILTRWIVLAGLIVIAFVATVTVLNSTLYGASGFVGSYLESLARHDVAGALAMPGVSLTGSGSRALVAPEALGTLRNIRLSSDVDDGAGRHTVSYGYSFNGTHATTEFTVEHIGSRFGVFSAWRFVESPQSVLSITPQHAASFSANGIALQSTAPGQSVGYRVLTPAFVSLSYASRYLAAPITSALVDKVGSTVDASVDIQANKSFVAEVKAQVDQYLSDCVKQKVLLPTACPMGKPITDRIQNAPTWSMKTYPATSIVPAGTSGSWQFSKAEGFAHLVVKVKSIFDGSLSTFDQDIAFTVSFLITFQPDGSPLIVGQ